MSATGDATQRAGAAAGAPSGSAPPRIYHLRSHHAVGPALAALGEAVGDWGGEWSARPGGGELSLPVQAGLRHGLLRGHAKVIPVADGCEIALGVASETWVLDRSAVLLLTMAAISGLAGVLWPFYPQLGRFVPIGLVLGITAWLAILSRLRHHGPAELLAEVEAALEGAGDAEAPPPPVSPQ